MPSELVIQFGGNALSGGLGDRIVGLVSAILLAQKLDKLVKIQWLSPSIAGILRIPENYMYRGASNLPVHIDAIDNRGLHRFPSLFRTQAAKWRSMKSPLVLRCNQNLFPNEPDVVQAVFPRIFRDYFIPVAKDLVPSNTHYVAVQLRTGDTYMRVGETKMCDNVSKTLECLAAFVQQQFGQVTKAVYFSTDHPTAKITFRKLLQGYNKEMLEVPGSENFHLERHTKGSKQQLHSLVRDLMQLVEAGCGLIISNYSNYGKLAAQVRNQPDTTWYLEKNTYQIVSKKNEQQRRDRDLESTFPPPTFAFAASTPALPAFPNRPT